LSSTYWTYRWSCKKKWRNEPEVYCSNIREIPRNAAEFVFYSKDSVTSRTMYCILIIIKIVFIVFLSLHALIKKKIKFSSLRKFIVEQLQSHISLTASSYMGKYWRISSYIRKSFLIYDFATAPLWISLYMRKLYFSFLLVCLLVLPLNASACLPAVSQCVFCKPVCLPAATLSICYQPCLYAVIPSALIQLLSYIVSCIFSGANLSVCFLWQPVSVCFFCQPVCLLFVPTCLSVFFCQPVCLLFVPTCLSAFYDNLFLCLFMTTCFCSFSYQIACLIFTVPFCANLSICLFVPTCLSAFLCQPVYLPFCASLSISPHVPSSLSACVHQPPTYLSTFCTNLSICRLVPTCLSAFLSQSVCLLTYANLSVCFFEPICLSVYLCQPVCLPFCANCLPTCGC
jgi:hypothetical protein